MPPSVNTSGEGGEGDATGGFCRGGRELKWVRTMRALPPEDGERPLRARRSGRVTGSEFAALPPPAPRLYFW